MTTTFLTLAIISGILSFLCLIAWGITAVCTDNDDVTTVLGNIVIMLAAIAFILSLFAFISLPLFLWENVFSNIYK